MDGFPTVGGWRGLPPIEFPSNSELLDRVFPAGTGRREVAVQAGGNLIAAYVVLVVACIVGVGGYTPQLRYWVVFGTVLGLTWIIASWFGNLVTRSILHSLTKRIERGGLKLTARANYIIARTKGFMFLGFFLIAVFVCTVIARPVIDWLEMTTGYTP